LYFRIFLCQGREAPP